MGDSDIQLAKGKEKATQCDLLQQHKATKEEGYHMTEWTVL